MNRAPPSAYPKNMPRRTPNMTVQGNRSLSSGRTPMRIGISEDRFASFASQETTVQNVRHNLTSYDAVEGSHHNAADGDSVLVINDILMAIDMSENGTMGCAFFSTHDNCLSVAQDVLLADEQTLQHFLTYIQPTSILISARFPDGLTLMLDDHVDRSFNEETGQGICVITVPNSEFSISAAQDRVSNVQFIGKEEPQAVFHSLEEYRIEDRAFNRALPASESASIRYLRFRANLGLENSISTTCVGVLIAEVNKRRTAHGQSNISLAESSYEMHDIKEFALTEYLYINATAMSSLQILQRETHPNVQTWNTNFGCINKKEGLSVYGLFHQLASTSQGRTNLRKIFLRPSLHIPTITARHQAISTLLRPQNSEILMQMTRSLQKVPNMKGIISRLRKGIDSTSTCHSSRNGVWAAIERFTSNIAEIQRLTGLLSGLKSAKLLRQFCDTVDVATIVSVGSLVNATIDFEQSNSRERYSIRSGIDTDLDNLKRHYDGMESFLTTVVKSITEQSASWARQYIKSCIFLPQLGFLLVIELDESTGQGKYSGEGQPDDSWQKIFSADGSACYKTRQMRDLDKKYGDIYCQIGDREVELLYQLAVEVLQQSSKLEFASESCGELDALLALALVASKYGWTEPTVGMNRRTSVVGGRHPLYELSTPSFIPNDFGDVGEGPEKSPGGMLVVTGPNHSGKSVYLKQVALIVYLAHIGSFVPAEKANIGATDKILVCMPAHESAAENESAFAADLKDILHTVKQATVNSLVLVDEFGKGTCPVNGAGLAAGLMDHFLALGFNHCPRILLATHFHEIFELESFHGYEDLDFAHMKVEINHETGKGGDPLTYHFALKNGRSSSSFGEQCAAMNGVPDVVVNRATAISSIIDRNEDLVTTCARLSDAEQAQLEVAEEVARQFISYNLRIWNQPGALPDAVGMLERLMSTRG